jgi:hypothetical protein
MRKIAGLIILSALFLGCVRHYYEYPRSQYRKLDIARLEIGIGEGEVKNKLGEPAYLIGYRFYKDGAGSHTVKVTQYMEAERYLFDGNSTDNLRGNYFIYYMDDKLVHISNIMINPREDWQKESDKIFEFRTK